LLLAKKINNIPIIIDKKILLLLSICNSDTLISNNININKNNIDIAPIYTNMYDIPIKFNPMMIKYIEISKNKAIKYNTDIIGFLFVIINMLDTILSIVNNSKEFIVNPFVQISFIIIKLFFSTRSW
jgi:hypothetical protein